MKKFLVFLCAMALVFGMSAGAGAYLIDIGDPSSELGYNLQNWGPIEPTTHGGGWGGFGDFDPPVETCRVISSPENLTGFEDWASIQSIFHEQGDWMTIRHLDGHADDSFYVYAEDSTELFYYPTDPAYNEYWAEHTFLVELEPGLHTIYFTIYQDHWDHWGVYGQVGIDWIEVNPVPEPATMLLLGSGLIGLAAVGRKKFFKKS